MRRIDEKTKKVLKKGEYPKSNGSYEFRYSNNGKSFSIYAKTLNELRIMEEEISRDLSIGITHSNNTVDDFFQIWKELKKFSSLRRSTLTTYIAVYERYVASGFGKKRIKDVHHSDVLWFYNSLLSERRIKTSTVALCDKVLRQVFDLAVRDDIVRSNPVIGATKELNKNPENAPKEIVGFTIDEQVLFESFLKSDKTYNSWYNIFIFMLWTGMRASEVTGLRWDDIDFENNTISIKHTLVSDKKEDGQASSYSLNPPKSKKGLRTIPMFPKARQALLDLKQYQTDCNIRSKNEIDGYTNFVFVNSSGNVYNYKKLNSALYRIRDAINAKYQLSGEDEFRSFSCHVFRHTLATRMYEAGIDPLIISRYLGHDVNMSTKVYINVSLESMIKGITKLVQNSDEYYLPENTPFFTKALHRDM